MPLELNEARGGGVYVVVDRMTIDITGNGLQITGVRRGAGGVTMSTDTLGTIPWQTIRDLLIYHDAPP